MEHSSNNIIRLLKNYSKNNEDIDKFIYIFENNDIDSTSLIFCEIFEHVTINGMLNYVVYLLGNYHKYINNDNKFANSLLYSVRWASYYNFDNIVMLIFKLQKILKINQI